MALMAAQREISVIEQCRARTKRLDDLLHDGEAIAAHAEIHELAHDLEKLVVARQVVEVVRGDYHDGERIAGAPAAGKLAVRGRSFAYLSKLRSRRSLG